MRNSSRARLRPLPLLLTLSALLVLGNLHRAQERPPRGGAGARDHGEPQPAPTPEPDPRRAFELYLGADAIGFGYRSAFHTGGGHAALEFVVNEDDDYALQARLMRTGEPLAEAPLAFGVGLELVAAVIDDSDAELGAIALTGAVEYGLELDYPVRLGVEASFAPDISTFADGTRVLDVRVRAEADLSDWATAFVGYRHFEVDLDGGDEGDIDSALHVGVRLGF